ncbi:MAG: hypothetical protein WCT05_01340 [Lentisphaeria bacterium]
MSSSYSCFTDAWLATDCRPQLFSAVIGLFDLCPAGKEVGLVPIASPMSQNN